MRLLVTRPAEDAERTAERLRRAGHDVLVAPLLEIQFGPPPLIAGAPSALLFTSLNGVRAVVHWGRAESWRDLPVLAVGDRTAEAARAAGFRSVESADGDAAALRALASQRLTEIGGMALWPSAAEPAADLVAPLAAMGIAVERVTAYRTAEASSLPDPVAAALRDGSVDGVLLYSPKSAAHFARLCGTTGVSGAGFALFALSAAVADAAGSLAPRDIFIASAPNEDALFALLTATSRS